MAKLRLGCSGWDYQEWVGPLYRSATESKLAAYSRVFDTAEINSTFYRMPEKGMVLGWARYTHDEFRFAAKVPQTVTHDRLCDVGLGAEKELLTYCEIMRPLLDAGKLGPLLLQLPPRLRFDPSKLRDFFAILPPEFTWALEPRNKTWMVEEAFELLAAHHVAYTIVDEPLLPPTLRVTARTAYVRWHGHGKDPWYAYRYSDEELRAWVPKVRGGRRPRGLWRPAHSRRWSRGGDALEIPGPWEAGPCPAVGVEGGRDRRGRGRVPRRPREGLQGRIRHRREAHRARLRGLGGAAPRAAVLQAPWRRRPCPPLRACHKASRGNRVPPGRLDVRAARRVTRHTFGGGAACPLVGVNLTPVAVKETISLDRLAGRTLAVDASIELYQFLSIMRLPDGSPLSDGRGHVTSHLNGILFRSTRLISEHQARLLYVFDGKPPQLKWREIEKRRAAKAKAEREHEAAGARGGRRAGGAEG